MSLFHRTGVCYPPSPHTHLWRFLLLWVFSGRKCWELPEKKNQILVILLVWCAHCAPAPANGLFCVHPQIPRVSWVVCSPLTSIYSQYFAGFQSCRGCKVFYYGLHKKREVVLLQKIAVFKRTRHWDGFKVEQHLFAFTVWSQVAAIVWAKVWAFIGLH